jgi:hypothetical protein
MCPSGATCLPADCCFRVKTCNLVTWTTRTSLIEKKNQTNNQTKTKQEAKNEKTSGTNSWATLVSKKVEVLLYRYEVYVSQLITDLFRLLYPQSGSFSCLITELLQELTRWMPQMEQELLTLSVAHEFVPGCFLVFCFLLCFCLFVCLFVLVQSII